jgi:uncharacterized repeat protein (TIGR03803 family)
MLFIMASLIPAAWCATKITVIHNFGAENDGATPNGPLLVDSNGNLFGVTYGGPGLYGNGVVFELTQQPRGQWTETVVHSFTGGDGGAIPWGSPTFDKTGNLIVTVQGYGSADIGGVFSFTRGARGWVYNILYTGGAGPGLLVSEAGDFYGSIGLGDWFGAGAIGELSPGSDGWNYTQLYSFCGPNGCPDGYDPLDPPIWDSNGNLWGTMAEGGIVQPDCPTGAGCGLIFAMTPNGDGTWTYHVVHRFASFPTDGQGPYGGLVMDKASNFYGTTDGGGLYGNGTIFQFSYNHGRLQGRYIYNFPNCMQGCYPMGTLARDSAGNLYGMAQGGTNSCGGLSCGVVYRLAPQSNGTWKYSVLVDLNETTGGVLPFYGLTLDDKGDLFGVTSNFGKYGGGTAFEITP